jgi:hypothetical protein
MSTGHDPLQQFGKKVHKSQFKELVEKKHISNGTVNDVANLQNL